MSAQEALLNVVGVQFGRAGKIYDFSPGEHGLRVGDQVVVETDRGLTLGKVATVKLESSQKYSEQHLKPVLRKASTEDLAPSGRYSEEEALRIASERAQRLNLKMRMLKADMKFGGNKVILYFNSPGRVDFRELVKDLATNLRARVELKQVGARDEAKLVGGLGICGREYCCSSFLREFVPVSIKMAKNQNLALNPSKVSGGCGRLLCCLTYENDVYSELRQKLPPLGTKVRLLEDGSEGRIIKTDILNQTVSGQFSETRILTVKLNEVEVLERGRDDDSSQMSEAEVWAEDIDLNLLEDDKK